MALNEYRKKILDKIEEAQNDIATIHDIMSKYEFMSKDIGKVVDRLEAVRSALQTLIEED